MVESTITSECNCETDVHLPIEGLRCLQCVDIVVTEALEGVIGSEVQLYQVSTY
jgi:hypothetical protein